MAGVYMQTQEELNQQLEKQLRFLSSSIASYDGGNEEEAIRMALAVRILVHDTPNSTSVLTHLNRKSGEYWDTSSPRQQGTSYYGLTLQGLLHDGRGKVFPLIDSNDAIAKLVPFDAWWDGVAIADFEGNEISRSKLVRVMANKDGGAHVDAELDSAYAALSRLGSMQTVTWVNNEWQKMPGPEYASMRQVAHELMKSLVPAYENKLTLPPNTIASGGIYLNIKPRAEGSQ